MRCLWPIFSGQFRLFHQIDDLWNGTLGIVRLHEIEITLALGLGDIGNGTAVDLVRAGVETLGGKGGGGRPDMAQGGGPDAAQADAALAVIEQRLSALAPAA